MRKYPIIAFEGIEASGKSTNIYHFCKYLKKNKINFIKFREPGGSIFSEKLRKLILNKKSELNLETDLLLIQASRSENCEKIIKKYLGKKLIIIDRFTDSTIAYQHYGMGMDIKIINQLNDFVTKKIKIDLTFLCTVNKSNMIKRLNLRKKINKYDKFNYSFYNKVQKGFIKLSKNHKKKYVLLDSNINNVKDNLNTIIKNFKTV